MTGYTGTGDRRTYFQLDNKWAGYTGTNELLPVGQKTNGLFLVGQRISIYDDHTF